MWYMFLNDKKNFVCQFRFDLKVNDKIGCVKICVYIFVEFLIKLIINVFYLLLINKNYLLVYNYRKFYVQFLNN